MARTRHFIFAILVLCAARSPWPLCAQRAVAAAPVNFEFVNQNVRDILYALSVYRRVPIVGDDTVSGSASLQYSGSDFDAAFDAFLSANRLFADKSGDRWTVSKIRIARGADGLLDVDAFDLGAQQIFDHLSEATGVTVLKDILPAAKISIRLSGVSPAAAIGLVMKPFVEYEVVVGEGYVQVRKAAAGPSPAISPDSGTVAVREAAGLFSLSGERFSLAEALSALFGAAGLEYSSFVRTDTVIDRLDFSGRPFGEALRLLLDQAGAEASRADGLWYVLPGQRSDIVERLKNEGRVWVRFPLRFTAFEPIRELLAARFPSLSPVPLSGGNGFFARVTPAEEEALGNFLGSVDSAGFKGTVRLKYIKSADVLQNVPPSVTKENLVDAGNGSTLFFVGSQDRYGEFLKDLELIDRPRTRIRYDLLIMQYQDSSDLKWGFNVDARSLAPGDQTLVTGSLGNILKLNFDVITVLGYRFAARLDTAISENQANVFADTTLYGLSGQEIIFQNSNTYRYRDYYVDTQTKETVYTGVTREITSGLVLNIGGWVSGDGMITTTVNASVSKRGADVSSSVGNPPPTSEKTITTQVRSRSGESVVLSGLRQDDSSFVEERVPFLSRIPLVGWLFKHRQSSAERNQMVIYLIPHVDLGTDAFDHEGPKTASVYERYVLPYLGEAR